ncbi:hypothetical protein T11_1451 [Trichinella zimbabwensis]|uniref:Uncharacterized protein n=1 Tax=Trichinella zimbabwensis TaxID=268475 RepID=A0A0V1I534_9BILA|nr:hypothetical protein T11_1451 [Trichinella zimbabwensis]
MVGNWRSRQELRYRNWLQTEVRRPLVIPDTFDGKKPFENWIVHFSGCDCSNPASTAIQGKTPVYRWRALLQHKMWEKWMYILGPLLRSEY